MTAGTGADGSPSRGAAAPRVGAAAGAGAPPRPRPRIPEPPPGRLDAEGFLAAFGERMRYQVARGEHTATELDLYTAFALAVRDRLVERWFRTQDAYYRADVKRVYYLTLEILPGRSLLAAILSLGALAACREAARALGRELEELEEQEWDPGLGSGGLGRLAACLMESAATAGLPLYGYGIRYDYGIFVQRIEGGWQVEAPDNWLRYGNPWEIPRPDALYPVRFYGEVAVERDAAGAARWRWDGGEMVMAMAYDVPVPGYRNGVVNTLRLWAAKATREFDLARFNAGEYVRAVEDKDRSESISRVLYPPDDQYAGKELRLKQQYFFVSASLQDILRRFRKVHDDWGRLPDRVAIHLNETHAALAIPELMRLLLDEAGLGWDAAWALTERVFAYTNHTVLPEALEAWPADLVGRLLPRHLQLVEEIDRRCRAGVAARWPEDPDRAARVAIVTSTEPRQVRMAPLALVGSHAVNGVSRLHTQILKRSVFADFHAVFPERFCSITNGISPRRWLLQANPALAALLTEALGEGWVTDLDRLRALRPLANDAGFRERWAAVKRANKAALAAYLRRRDGLELDPETWLDCQVKRMHEYKRQLLAVLHVLVLYRRLRDGTGDPGPPRTVLFAGKAAPTYTRAKLVIRLIHAVAARLAQEPAVARGLRVVFVPNYGVSVAERIFPACELSEQLSTAGMEASGTGNMKAALNGALTVGTLDGANLELLEAVGPEGFFAFGHSVEGLAALRERGYEPGAWLAAHPELAAAVAMLEADWPGAEPGLFRPLAQALREEDRYFHCADFPSYLEAQAAAAAVYRKPEEWTRRSILTVAGMGWCSSDRTVAEYARRVWGVAPAPVPGWPTPD